MGKLLWTSALSSLFSRSWWIHLRCSPAGPTANCRPRKSPTGTCQFRKLLHVFYFNPFRIFPKLLRGFRQHWEPQRCLRLFWRMRTTPRGEEKENKQDVPNLRPLLVINKRLVGRKRHFIYAQNKTREWRRSKWVAGESESFIWLSVSDQTGVSPPGFTILCQGPSLPLPRLFHVFCFFLFPWTLFLSCPFPSPLAAASRQRSARCRRLLFLSLTPSNLPH